MYYTRCRRATLRRGESSGAEWRSFDHGRPESDEENEHDGEQAVEENPEEVDPGLQLSPGNRLLSTEVLVGRRVNAPQGSLVF
ncbi:hypothetical protein HPB52_012544 [Rhipicephalus sanguineus]|uniref:Uncharacterized protein n=1 Tax=Rhipicephalus sanguineus TaxID=34632 RepID=A0A9D4PJC4_RHISA|nr:hypothetical protein HPB52_012544 [Rhipicephalus sanguineus]